MALIQRESVNVQDFIHLTGTEKLSLSLFTRVKSVRISTVDKLIAKENDSLSDVDLLKGVKLVKNGYVCLVGLIVSGEWNLPDNCRGGVSVCLIDKRMKRSQEATLGSYNAPACKKNFSFKLIPNYSVTTADAERRPWQVLVNIKGVSMVEGYCPLSLEFVSVCVVHKNNVRKGLRERVTNVTDEGPLELTEAVVEEFMDDVPMAVRLASFNKRKNNRFVNNNKKENNKNIGKGFVKKPVENKDKNKKVSGEVKVKEIGLEVDEDYSIEESSDSYF
ncbi:MP [Brugmansia latent virus]|nr:MP [Brugmansia latent virus]